MFQHIVFFNGQEDNYLKDFSKNELYRALHSDDILSEDKLKHQETLTFAEMYLGEFQDNYMLSSFELDEKYGTYDYEAWKNFLNLPQVSKYRNQFVAEASLAKAEQDILVGNKSKDAIAVRDKMIAQLGADDNSRIVIMRMPPKTSVKQ